MDLDKYEHTKYFLVDSIHEGRTYYLITPEKRELVFMTDWNRSPKKIYSDEANYTESTVANQLYKTNQIIN